MIFSKEDVYQSLTNKEARLLELLSQGKTRCEIADILCISVNTYDSYRKNIRSKLDIHSQADWAKVLCFVAGKSQREMG